MTEIPVIAGCVDYTPPSLRADHGHIVFLVKIPTWADRDEIGTTLYRMGVRPVNDDQIRSHVLNALWDLFDDDEADKHGRFLEGFWQRQTAHRNEVAEWQAQEAVRIMDEDMGAEPRPSAPMPEEKTTVRERALAASLVNDVIDRNDRLRNVMADQQAHDIRFRDMIGRLRIAGWQGIPDVIAGSDRRFNALTTDTVESLRSFFASIGCDQAWQEVCDYANGLFDLPRGTEKNSESLPEITGSPDASTSSISGSPAQTTTGESMISNTESPPTGISGEMSEASSVSTIGFADMKETYGQTEGASPINPSAL